MTPEKKVGLSTNESLSENKSKLTDAEKKLLNEVSFIDNNWKKIKYEQWSLIEALNNVINPDFLQKYIIPKQLDRLERNMKA
jgi:hypothetical protein